jgi:hypothetical protein
MNKLNKMTKLNNIMKDPANMSRFLALFCVFFIKDFKDGLINDIIVPNLNIDDELQLFNLKIYKKKLVIVLLDISVYMIFLFILIYYFVV